MADDRKVNIKINIETTTSQRATAALSQELEKLKTQLDQAGNKTTSFTASAEKMSGLNKVADGINGSFGKMVGAFTIAGVAANAISSTFATVSNALRNAAQESINLNRQILAIETILPRGTKVGKDMVVQMEALGERFGTAASTQAKAFYDIMSAGIEDTADATKLLEQANNLAVGGLATTGETIKLLTTIYNVYGKELATSSDAADSLFKTVQIGRTNITELSADLGQALPIAKSFGITLDEVGHILATFTNAGISTAESTTLLNALLSAIAKNGKDLGPTMNSAAVQTDGLAVVLERLKERTNLSSDALFTLLGRQEAVRAVQTLASKGLEGYNKQLDQFSDKAGVAADAARKMLDEDVSRQWDIATTKIGNFFRGLADDLLPAANSALKWFNETTDSLNKSLNNYALNAWTGSLEILEEAYKEGSVSAQEYAEKKDIIVQKLKELKAEANTINPAKVELSFDEKQAEAIRQQIFNIQMGFDVLSSMGPLEKDLKIKELNDDLLILEERIKAAQKARQGVSNEAVVDPEAEARAKAEAEQKAAEEARKREIILNERAKLKAELKQVDAEIAATEKQTAEANEIAKIEDETLRREAELIADYEHKQALIEAEYKHQMAMAELIKNAKNQQLAEDLAGRERELALSKLKQEDEKKRLQDKLKLDEKNKNDAIKIERALQAGKVQAIQAGVNLATALTADGSKEQFLIQKGFALYQAYLSMQQGIALANTVPPPGNVAAAAYAKTTGLLNIAAIVATTLKGIGSHEDGGMIGANGRLMGAGLRGDRQLYFGNAGEVVLNQREQRVISDLVGGGSFGNNSVIVELLSNISNNVNQAPIILVDGTILTREINRVNNLRLVG